LDLDDKISKIVKEFRPSGIRAFFDIVATREDCISLGVGEPDFISPQPVLESAVDAIRDGFTHYTGNQGLLSLRKEICNYLENEYQLNYDFEKEVLITVGVSQGLDIALRSVINAGDEVIYCSPSYVSYEPLIKLSGGTAVAISTNVENKFKITPEQLEQACTNKTKAILLNFPCNPTGASYSHHELEKLAVVIEKHNILVISDEIYADLTYDSVHTPISAIKWMKERTLILGGFSKGFAMTGWRIGYICGPEVWVNAVTKIHQYSMLCAPTISQIAAESALKNATHDKDLMKASYHERRNLICDGFNKIGLRTHIPEGAFYVFPEIKSTKYNSMDFATALLEQKNVAVVPGTAFGPEGEGYIRCSYATSLDEIKIALERIEEFILP